MWEALFSDSDKFSKSLLNREGQEGGEGREGSEGREGGEGRECGEGREGRGT